MEIRCSDLLQDSVSRRRTDSVEERFWSKAQADDVLVAGGAEHAAAVIDGCRRGRWPMGTTRGVGTVWRSEFGPSLVGQYFVCERHKSNSLRLGSARLRLGRVGPAGGTRSHSLTRSHGVARSHSVAGSRAPMSSSTRLFPRWPRSVRSAFGQPSAPRGKNPLPRAPGLTLVPDLGNDS